MASPKKEKWYRKLRYKYRFVILHDDTFEERFTFRLSRMNVFVSLVSLSVVLITVTGYIIAFTSLREYIPGYTDVNLNKRVYEMERRADSLENVFRQKELYMENFRRIVDGYDFSNDSLEAISNTNQSARQPTYDSITLTKSPEDSLLRLEFEAAEKYNLYSESGLTPESRKRAMAVANFFVPVKGTITNHFNPSEKHYGVDVVAQYNEAIKSTLDGTVVYADWTLNTGYVIGVQHAGNFFSVYKHNSVLLKKEGDLVKAGEPIAIIGETGELATGPHLHFELWFNGMPINPEEYLSFN